MSIKARMKPYLLFEEKKTLNEYGESIVQLAHIDNIEMAMSVISTTVVNNESLMYSKLKLIGITEYQNLSKAHILLDEEAKIHYKIVETLFTLKRKNKVVLEVVEGL